MRFVIFSGYLIGQNRWGTTISFSLHSINATIDEFFLKVWCLSRKIYFEGVAPGELPSVMFMPLPGPLLIVPLELPFIVTI